ncbi:uncharacterized protein LOC119179283 [Rhipicephalus microplus]|uniref:uncharacterized protein LOC119179283 n=1 Tax=Rhipicephalus microplus TaxID=6941 RepID=UPI0018889D37|nr:uncharacterized protein LOC119179283 [Rhipicephalus microplus]
MFTKEVSVVVMALCVVKLVTSGDEVVLPSSSSGVNITGNMRSMNEDQVMSLHELLKRKMERTRGLVSLGMDPFQAGSMGFLIQEPGAYINVSLTKLAVTGLSNFTIRDVATNNAAMRASVLMIMPRVEIRCAYRVKGYISGEGERESRVIDESGQFEAVLGRAAMSWFARVLHVDKDDLLVAQTGLRTHVDEVVTKRFQPTAKARTQSEDQDVMGVVGDSIVDHVRHMVEEKLNKVITKAVSTKPSEVQDLLESLVVPTPHSEVPRTFSPHGHRISKRQVPCNNGTELDDYVDYLFRFATRLIRAMEPIQGPNFTIYIEEHLQVFLYDVQARNVYTLSRRKPAYVICKHGDVTVGLVIRLDSIMATAKYRVLTDHRHLLYNGDADMKLSGTVVWIQISQLANGNNRLDVVRIWRLGKAQVLLKGLGNLTSAISMLLTSVLNHDPWNIIPVAEAQAITFGREMLANITVPIFSLV